MRRNGLRRAGAWIFLGALSALAMTAAAPVAFAESDPDQLEETVAVEPAMPADGTAPVAAAGKMDVPPAAAPQSAEAPAPAPADTVVPASMRKDNTGRTTSTRYSKRQQNAIVPAGDSAAGKAAPVAAEIVCRAGCGELPGPVVYAAPAAPAAPLPAVQSSAVGAGGTSVQAAAIACVAGCGHPEVANLPVSTESAYLTTESKMPADSSKRPASGEWMVKINRERGR